MKMQCAETESAMLFWAMLNYALWKRLCVDGEPLDTLREELAASIADCAGSRLELEVDERRGLVRSEHQNP
jgi:hypothetical protein